MTQIALLLMLLIARQGGNTDPLLKAEDIERLIATTAIQQLHETDLPSSRTAAEVYRAVFIPQDALRGPTSVRLEKTVDHWILTTSTFSQPRKGRTSQLMKPKTRKLHLVDVSPIWDALNAEALNQMSLDEPKDRICLDDTFWLYERIESRKYERAMSYCPATPRFKAFGEALLRLAGPDLK
jgi:hypothetical protein